MGRKLVSDCKHDWEVWKDAEWSTTSGQREFAIAHCPKCDTRVSVADAMNIELYRHMTEKEFFWSKMAVGASGIAIVVSIIALFV